MYECKTAISYLAPKKGQLSISIVGLIAVLVIQAISWLVLVFFSTTAGLESRWSDKITSILGTIQITPTSEYTNSPFSHENGAQRISCTLSDSSSPGSILLQNLQKNDITALPFESTITHLHIPNLSTSPERSLSQYSYIFGVTRPSEKLRLHKEISPSEVETAILFLRKKNVSIPLLRNFFESIESLEICTLPQGQQQRAIINPEKFNISLPKEKKIFSLFSNHLPFTIVHVTPKKSPRLIQENTMKYIKNLGYPVFLSRQMREQGARLLDSGIFEYSGFGMTGEETLTLPFYIAGFFDPGILPIGSKVTIAALETVQAIQSELPTDTALSGFYIESSAAPSCLQKEITKSISQSTPNIFSAKRFDQYDATKEVYKQLKSEKNLFTLLSWIIIIVACSNIFSMLFILAHDRRKEIAILRALGASKKSIAAIFILSGLGIGLFGSILGALLASVTLHYLPELLQFLSYLQGQDILQHTIYGEIASQRISLSTLSFTLFSISLTASLAGALAAIRACHTNVSQALKG